MVCIRQYFFTSIYYFTPSELSQYADRANGTAAQTKFQQQYSPVDRW